jgi:hypothetical protein
MKLLDAHQEMALAVYFRVMSFMRRYTTHVILLTLRNIVLGSTVAIQGNIHASYARVNHSFLEWLCNEVVAFSAN